MMLLPYEEEKTKVNNEKRKFGEKVVDSTMRVAGEIVGRSGRPQGNQQPGGNILDVVDTNAQPAQSKGGGILDAAMQGYDPEKPFSTGAYPTVSSGGTTVPTYNVNEVLGGGRMESTEAPVRDAAAYERIQKQQKFNAISKGLQSLFGGIVGAAGGGGTPGPYQSGMTQALMSNLQGLDDKYFREMAEWRDRELRTEMHNANLDARDDEIRRQKFMYDIERLERQGRHEEAKALEAKMFEYQQGIDAQKIDLQNQDIDVQRQRLGMAETNQRGVPEEHKGIYDAFVEQKIKELKAQKNNPNILDTSKIDEQIEALENIPYTFGEKSGFAERTYRDAVATYEQQQQMTQEAQQGLMGIQQGIIGGQYKDADTLRSDLVSNYMKLGYDEAKSTQTANDYINSLGIFSDKPKPTPSERNESQEPSGRTGGRTYSGGSGQPSPKEVYDQRREKVAEKTNSLLSGIENTDARQRITKKISSNPLEAAEELAEELRKSVKTTQRGSASSEADRRKMIEIGKLMEMIEEATPRQSGRR